MTNPPETAQGLKEQAISLLESAGQNINAKELGPALVNIGTAIACLSTSPVHEDEGLIGRIKVRPEGQYTVRNGEAALPEILTGNQIMDRLSSSTEPVGETKCLACDNGIVETILGGTNHCPRGPGSRIVGPATRNDPCPVCRPTESTLCIECGDPMEITYQAALPPGSEKTAAVCLNPACSTEQGEGDVEREKPPHPADWAAFNEYMEDAKVRERWLPTPENINALPEPLRQYVHDLQTRCDPAGDIRELAIAKDTIAALAAQVGAQAPVVWLYKQTEFEVTEGRSTFTVGFYRPDNGEWFAESDYKKSKKAARRVAYLNGRDNPLPEAEAPEVDE